MLRITVEPVDNAGYSERSGTSKDGKPYRIARQTVYMHNGKVHPTPVDLSIRDGAKPYEPGEYTIAASSFKLGTRGIELDPFNVELVSLQRKPAAAA